ncbi:hypothetical protein ACJO2E_08665 [Marinobacter sp. M1N3S26]|uniref:hypothetical protein n=1 Tax=Marinobacter sp. M1N3S26 TaxID=3382299 RepID=UPI00387AAA79
MITQSGLLCNHKVSVYRSAMDKADLECFRLRLKEAIEQSPPSQTEIANYCDVTVQSVGGWKRSGQISKDNLKKTSIITGYRYLWILKGEGPKLVTDEEENIKEMQIAETRAIYSSDGESENVQRLISSLNYALANNRLSEESVGLLADFVHSLVTKKKP